MTACQGAGIYYFFQFINRLALFLIFINPHKPIHEAQINFDFLWVGKPLKSQTKLSINIF